MTWRGILAGALGAVLLMAGIALFVILSGTYNVAATERHTALGQWALDTTFRNSVESRAAGIDPPATFTAAMLEAGAGEYKAMCEHCHGGVGTDRAEWAEGMLPLPPALAEETGEWSHAEVFWLVRHGAKLTGMPAFGPTHEDAPLWNIAGFVKALPEMSGEEYAGYASEHGGGGGDGHSHAPGTPPHED
jgi:mono/diheme cytochrome c family protein